MTLILIIFILIIAIGVAIVLVLTKLKQGIGSEKRDATEDLLKGKYIKPDNPSIIDGLSETGRKKSNGTAVLNEDDVYIPKGKKGGTAVLRVEDNPENGYREDYQIEQANRKEKKRGTAVLKPEMLDDSEDDRNEDNNTSTTPPTVLLKEEVKEEPDSFIARQLKNAHKRRKAILQQERTKERIEITGNSLKVGREKADVDLCIEENLSVSRHHATISRKGDDYYITDHGSLNFTFVNNLKLKPEKEMKLKNKDKISFGDEIFTFFLK